MTPNERTHDGELRSAATLAPGERLVFRRSWWFLVIVALLLLFAWAFFDSSRGRGSSFQAIEAAVAVLYASTLVRPTFIVERHRVGVMHHVPWRKWIDIATIARADHDGYWITLHTIDDKKIVRVMEWAVLDRDLPRLMAALNRASLEGAFE